MNEVLFETNITIKKQQIQREEHEDRLNRNAEMHKICLSFQKPLFKFDQQFCDKISKGINTEARVSIYPKKR